jgi:FkbM family methyltransferase
MDTPRINWNPLLTKHLVQLGVFHQDPFCLVDVGVSGGIDRFWEPFGDDLRAIGFDGLTNEIRRLNAEASSDGRQYYNYLVGDKRYVAPTAALTNHPWSRTSSSRALEIMHCNYMTEEYDQTGSGECTSRMIELDHFLLREHPTLVNFIKIDTDGEEYQVLRGARELLLQSGVLGIAVECQFHGALHAESSTFRNIDRLLTSSGYSLFDLETYRYSRRALPKPFSYRVPACTDGGQLIWGDALYLRDAGSDKYERDWRMSFSPHDIMKLACIFEIFGLEDCSAELMQKYRPQLLPLIDVEACLNMLVPVREGKRTAFADYTSQFEADPSSFYPT